MPYFPGARQDRGEPFTARVMSNLISSLNFGSVIIYDPHSEVIVNELSRTNQLYAHGPSLPAWPHEKYSAIIVPDEGAVIRSLSIAADLGYEVDIVKCVKKRDPVTGALSGFELVTKDLPEGTYLLFDDICDGGGTFNGVAAIVDEQYRKQYGRAADIDLFVTHGIFSKGTDELFKNFTTIYSTTSWRSHEELLALDVIPIPIHNLENRA
jgi:ribose-phosphate pyrophosphokinase